MQFFGTSRPACVPMWVRTQLYKLTFRHMQSPMLQAAKDIFHSRLPGKIVYAIEDIKVLSWGLFVWRTDNYAPEIMLYTRRSARGLGLGKDIFWGLRHSLAEDASYAYYPHDKTAYNFYMKRYAERCAGTAPASKVVWLKQ